MFSSLSNQVITVCRWLSQEVFECLLKNRKLCWNFQFCHLLLSYVSIFTLNIKMGYLNFSLKPLTKNWNVNFSAFATRLFSVLRFESVIHEFDPYFNYRTTRFLAEEGFYKFHNWFDDRAWYPLGRIIGGIFFFFAHRQLRSLALWSICYYLLR